MSSRSHPPAARLGAPGSPLFSGNPIDSRVFAVVCIQRMFRGILVRKLYRNQLEKRGIGLSLRILRKEAEEARRRQRLGENTTTSQMVSSKLHEGRRNQPMPQSRTTSSSSPLSPPPPASPALRPDLASPASPAERSATVHNQVMAIHDARSSATLQTDTVCSRARTRRPHPPAPSHATTLAPLAEPVSAPVPCAVPVSTSASQPIPIPRSSNDSSLLSLSPSGASPASPSTAPVFASPQTVTSSMSWHGGHRGHAAFLSHRRSHHLLSSRAATHGHEVRPTPVRLSSSMETGFSSVSRSPHHAHAHSASLASTLPNSPSQLLYPHVHSRVIPNAMFVSSSCGGSVPVASLRITLEEGQYILGSVDITPTFTLEEVRNAVCLELDGVPDNFVFVCDGVPIGLNQEHKRLAAHYTTGSRLQLRAADSDRKLHRTTRSVDRPSIAPSADGGGDYLDDTAAGGQHAVDVGRGSGIGMRRENNELLHARVQSQSLGVQTVLASDTSPVACDDYHTHPHAEAMYGALAFSCSRPPPLVSVSPTHSPFTSPSRIHSVPHPLSSHGVHTHPRSQSPFRALSHGDSSPMGSACCLNLPQTTAAARPTVAVMFSAPLAYLGEDRHLHSMPLVDHETERELICRSFEEAAKDIALTFGFATTDYLRSVVTRGCRVLHYSGHANPQVLSFEDGFAGVHFVRVDQLRSLFAAGGAEGKPELCVVSACSSRFAGEAFVEAGVRHVVCVELEVDVMDRAAAIFTRAFYLALIHGKAVRASFDIGCEAVKASPGMTAKEASKFLLLPAEEDHCDALFPADLLLCDWHSPPPLGLDSIPAPPEGFLGRALDMYAVAVLILRHRLVSIVGPSGYGKTSVALAVANYLSERRLFREGVFFVSLAAATTVEEVTSAIARELQLPPAIAEDVLFAHLQRKQCLLVLDAPVLPASPQSQSASAAAPASAPFFSLATYSQPPFGAPGIPLPKDSRGFRGFLGKLLEQTRGVKVIATSLKPISARGPLFGAAEKVHELHPLDPLDAARLLLKRAPRRIEPDELNCSSFQELFRRLSLHPAVRALRNVPGLIVDAAIRLRSLPLSQMGADALCASPPLRALVLPASGGPVSNLAASASVAAAATAPAAPPLPLGAVPAMATATGAALALTPSPERSRIRDSQIAQDLAGQNSPPRARSYPSLLLALEQADDEDRDPDADLDLEGEAPAPGAGHGNEQNACNPHPDTRDRHALPALHSSSTLTPQPSRPAVSGDPTEVIPVHVTAHAHACTSTGGRAGKSGATGGHSIGEVSRRGARTEREQEEVQSGPCELRRKDSASLGDSDASDNDSAS